MEKSNKWYAHIYQNGISRFGNDKMIVPIDMSNRYLCTVKGNTRSDLKYNIVYTLKGMEFNIDVKDTFPKGSRDFMFYRDHLEYFGKGFV